jgi:acid stress-induced BolA-like protein IbaG/YrbA
MMTTDEVKQLIEAGITGSNCEVMDLTGTGDHFRAVVTSGTFAGKSLIEQHKMVYGTVTDYMADQRIHALSLKTITP